MSEERKYIIIRIAIVSIILVLVVVNILKYQTPTEIIEQRIHLKLPTTSKIINFSNNILTEDFEAKILLNKHDIEKIKNDLHKYFGHEYDGDDLHIPNTWWDIDKNNIVSCYMALKSPKKYWILPTPKTVTVWAFIVKQSDGKFYLYILH